MSYLKSLSQPLPSAASHVDPDLDRALLATPIDDIRSEARSQAVHDRGALCPSDGWWDYDEWSERIWVGPDLLTTPEAARASRVSPATIRQWVARGHLTPVGRRGRANLFRATDVLRTHEDTRSRNRQPTPLQSSFYGLAVPDARRGVTSTNLDDLVTAAEGARNAGVPVATVRSWAHRGLLTAADRRGRTPLFVRADVLRVARRSPYQPKRKPLIF